MKVKIIDKKYNFLIPIKTNNLVRIGNKMDGDYVVDKSSINKIDNFISIGLGDGTNTDNAPWSFENDLLKINSNIKISIYDHSVFLNDYFKIIFKYLRRFLTFRTTFSELNKRIKYLIRFLELKNSKKINFYREKVVAKFNSKKNNSNISKIFARLNNNSKLIGLKCDIEGDEYEIIDEVLKYKNYIKLMIFEFHSTDLKNDLFVKCVKMLQEHYHIIHLHGNNHKNINQDGLPNVLEITFLNKENFKNNEKLEYVYNFPIQNLDYPCDPTNDEIKISFE